MSSRALDADDAVVGEGDGGIGQELDGLKKVVGDHGLEDVELEMAMGTGEGDSRVVADDLGADLRDRLALGGVDLAGHDRGAGLVFRQRQFAQAGAWAGAEEPDVVGDLEE